MTAWATSNHLHPLQVENCDSNSWLVVDEDDNESKMHVTKLIALCIGVTLVMHTVCMLTSGNYGDDKGAVRSTSKRHATQAMLIIAFLMYFAATIIALVTHYWDIMTDKMSIIITCILSFIGGLFTLIGVAVYGAALEDDDQYDGELSAYSATVYIIDVFGAFVVVFLGVISLRQDTHTTEQPAPHIITP